MIKFLHEVAELKDPRVRGKSLVGDKSGLWRWRVRDYRVIVSFHDAAVIVNVVDVSH
ncbi:MAG: type II toxin-antitoxin system RelE/ParE family toxin [Corynebacterium sp.]|nr:type II toxin-antitoxin system RelE/ParE family toxin [Corynebacterium sp.]